MDKRFTIRFREEIELEEKAYNILKEAKEKDGITFQKYVIRAINYMYMTEHKGLNKIETETLENIKDQEINNSAIKAIRYEIGNLKKEMNAELESLKELLESGAVKIAANSEESENTMKEIHIEDVKDETINDAASSFLDSL